ncbi:methyltransferase [Candidatus Roizmanbacteria bacterium RIFCSPHIGHO2_12_FULL_37_9b]|uniref:Methyltransferase n=1 Tax=Candidatus Roizmanbacteria bacterium RIFCSPHIGHO2_02_FULL_38_11 TaxID=1802039 RepID=A0A1F7H018_9BACT|nr:MAG: methyltransferase [Candidatus Roizmanbacteria bacterium RIFCSPHIGHO2_02_FULL_38_11]OGK35266.1 MAG: methyltransferase [Candidatus Roizmanbacteria bacterium RIFCSPHIGHO2_12_FULL_37_9b]
MLNTNKLNKDIVFKKQLRGADFIFHSTWGLFSPKDLDEGSKLLIDNLDVNPTDISLDLGCGYGAIGITIAKLSPKGFVHLIDKDFVAVEYAKKNTRWNKLVNCDTYLSNGFSNVPNIQFNNIVSNIPAKVGKELYWIIIKDAKKHLKKDGKLYFVFISGLKKFFKRNFNKVFGNYTHIASSKTYTVAYAIKK